MNETHLQRARRFWDEWPDFQGTWRAKVVCEAILAHLEQQTSAPSQGIEVANFGMVNGPAPSPESTAAAVCNSHIYTDEVANGPRCALLKGHPGFCEPAPAPPVEPAQTECVHDWQILRPEQTYSRLDDGKIRFAAVPMHKSFERIAAWCHICGALTLDGTIHLTGSVTEADADRIHLTGLTEADADRIIADHAQAAELRELRGALAAAKVAMLAVEEMPTPDANCDSFPLRGWLQQYAALTQEQAKP